MDLSEIDIMGPEIIEENPITVNVGDLIFYIRDGNNEIRTRTEYTDSPTKELYQQPLLST